MKSVNGKRLKSVLACVGTALLITGLSACDWSADSELNTSRQVTSPAYSAGYEFGIRLAILQQKQPGSGLDEAFEVLCDAMADANLQLSRIELCELQPAEPRPADVEIKPSGDLQPPQAQGRSRNIADFVDNGYDAAGSEPGGTALSGGVQYEVLYEGSGEPPQPSDTVLIRYQASLDSGFIIDASEGNDPLRMSLNDVLAPGLKEVLLRMNAGARWQVILPPSTDISRPGSRMLRGREKRTTRKGELIYDIELVSIERVQPAKAGN